MNNKVDCYDNALIESFFGALKNGKRFSRLPYNIHIRMLC